MRRMSSIGSRERAADTLPRAGARSGNGANSVVPYMDQEEDEKPSGSSAPGDGPLQEDLAAGGGDEGNARP